MLTGSITLAHLLIAEGMADEFRMFCCPAAQGTGRRFFPEGYAARLTRVDARASATASPMSPIGRQARTTPDVVPCEAAAFVDPLLVE